MGFRFRARFKIAPGVRLNLSKGGSSWTLGRRGASVNVGGKRGRVTVGIPGSGISYTEPLEGAAPAPAESAPDLGRIFRLLALLVTIGFFALLVMASG